jgi:hypothetical protein
MHTTKYSKKQHRPTGPYVKKYKGGGLVTGILAGLGGAMAANALRNKKNDVDNTKLEQAKADAYQDGQQDAEEDK